MPLCSADSGSLRGAVMNGDIEATGASALMTSHMSGRMISQIAVVGGRRRWSMDQKLEILREAFGPDGSVGATCQRHAIGSGLIYTWRRQALAGDLTGTKRAPPPSFAEVEVAVPTAALRSEERRVGQGWGSTWRSRWSPDT